MRMASGTSVIQHVIVAMTRLWRRLFRMSSTVADETGISWTEATWNPWMGCTKVSEGCDNCYMFREQRQYGNDPELVRRSKTKFDAPLKWKQPKLVFTCSWADWFHIDADQWRDEAWEIVRASPQHTFQILTKRPGRIARCLPADWGDGYPNVWLVTSVETDEYLSRARVLREIPAALRFLSLEPLLGPLISKATAGSSQVANPVPGTDRSRRSGCARSATSASRLVSRSITSSGAV